MGKKGIETLVGLFVLLGILGLVFLALKAANLASFSSGDTYTVMARFDNIGGLKVRAPVRSAGVTVGRIVAQGTPAELMGSNDPEVRQFVRGEPDGPVKFHYPAPTLAADFGVRTGVAS